MSPWRTRTTTIWLGLCRGECTVASDQLVPCTSLHDLDPPFHALNAGPRPGTAPSLYGCPVPPAPPPVVLPGSHLMTLLTKSSYFLPPQMECLATQIQLMQGCLPLLILPAPHQTSPIPSNPLPHYLVVPHIPIALVPMPAPQDDPHCCSRPPISSTHRRAASAVLTPMTQQKTRRRTHSDEVASLVA